MKNIYTRVQNKETGEKEIKKFEITEFTNRFLKANADFPERINDTHPTKEECVEKFILAIAGGNEEMPDNPMFDRYRPFYAKLVNYVKASNDIIKEVEGNKDEEKAKREKEREEKKKAKEAEEKKQKEQQDAFLAFMGKGQKKAEKVVTKEFEFLAKALGGKIRLDVTNGVNVIIDPDASVEDIGNAIGQMVNMKKANEIKDGAMQFSIGDLTNELVKRKVYKNVAQASQSISDKLDGELRNTSIRQYAIMADRIPSEHRSLMATPTVYYQIAMAAQPKQLKDESDADFKKRHEAHTKARLELADQASKGKVKSIKKAKELVDAMQKEHGLAKDKGDAKVSVSQLTKNIAGIAFAIALMPKTNGKVKFKAESGTMSMTEADLQELMKKWVEEYGQRLYGDDYNNVITGKCDQDLPVIDSESGKPKKDDDGNIITTTKEAPFNVAPPFEIPSDEKEKKKDDSEKEEEDQDEESDEKEESDDLDSIDDSEAYEEEENEDDDIDGSEEDGDEFEDEDEDGDEFEDEDLV